jgi:predicted nucleic acid-binding protein
VGQVLERRGFIERDIENACQLVDAVLDSAIDILMSDATLAELASRLDRPKFGRYRTPMQFLQSFRESNA